MIDVKIGTTSIDRVSFIHEKQHFREFRIFVRIDYLNYSLNLRHSLNSFSTMSSLQQHIMSVMFMSSMSVFRVKSARNLCLFPVCLYDPLFINWTIQQPKSLLIASIRNVSLPLMNYCCWYDMKFFCYNSLLNIRTIPIDFAAHLYRLCFRFQ